MMDELRELYQEVIWITARIRGIFARWKTLTVKRQVTILYAVTAWSSRCVLMKTVWFRMPPSPATVAQFRWRRHR